MTQPEDVNSQALTEYQVSQWPPTTVFNDVEMCEDCMYNAFIAVEKEEYRHDCTCGLQNYMDP
jgi:hypothetical protein